MTDYDISYAVRAVSQAAGQNYISAATLGIRPDALAAAQHLAIVCGFTGASVSVVDHEELAALYATARKSGAAARGMAQRLSVKYARSNKPDPFGLVGGMPRNLAEPMPPAQRPVDFSLVHARIDGVEQVVTGLSHGLDDLKLSLEAMAREIPHAVAEALSNQQPTNLVLTMPLGQVVPVGLVHKQTPTVIKYLTAGVNVYLHGPAGSGKTFAGQQIAKSLGLTFHFTGKVESEYALLGFTDAQSKVVRTPFREAYENGGLFLFDELDRSNPSAVVALNAALANGVCAFPDGTVTRHKDFKCIAAGNTTLTGATMNYATASQFDASSVNRFEFIPFPYDEALERATASNQDWCTYVQLVRAVVKDKALDQVLVTPRATIAGCTLLEAGVDWPDVAESCIWKGLDPETVEQIEREVDKRKARAPSAPAGAVPHRSNPARGLGSIAGIAQEII